MHNIAVSIGDLNGVGIEIALKAHDEISKICKPLYCLNQEMLSQAAKLLDLDIPENFAISPIPGVFEIKPGTVDSQAGLYSFNSFIHALNLTQNFCTQALITLPVNKESWSVAKVPYKGHTDALRDLFKQDAIMMMGCEKMYVALYTDHVRFSEIGSYIHAQSLEQFLTDLYRCSSFEKIAVLGLNPHAGDGGVLGDEEEEIQKAITSANRTIDKTAFYGPLVPDTAFTPAMRERFKVYVAMYHDQGLIPLKSHYFDESINVSLNLPVIRTSVDHGTAFDIAYKNQNPSPTSYINAIKAALNFSNSPTQ